MYDFLRGSAASLDTSGHLAFEVNGVGYLLRISEQTRARIPLDGSSVVIHTRLVVRDDDLQLYGFADPAERAGFDLLTGVQGVGSVVALAILSAFPVAELRQVLVRKDVATLKKVKGVGAKSAERLALELHDKVDRIPVPFASEDHAGDSAGPVLDQAVDHARQALVALGFSAKDALDVVSAVADEAGDDSETLVRLALARLR